MKTNSVPPANSSEHFTHPDRTLEFWNGKRFGHHLLAVLSFPAGPHILKDRPSLMSTPPTHSQEFGLLEHSAGKFIRKMGVEDEGSQEGEKVTPADSVLPT